MVASTTLGFVTDFFRVALFAGDLTAFVALGAGGEDAAAKCLHSSTTYGTLRMDDYAFS